MTRWRFGSSARALPGSGEPGAESTGQGFRSHFLKKLLRLATIRPEEVPITLLMSLYFFLVMSAVSMVKSIQNALYLSQVGFEGLPGLYLILAIVSVPTVVGFQRLEKRFSRGGLGIATFIGLLLSVVVFLILFSAGFSWFYPAFYVWGSIFSLLLPTVGWMVCYSLFTPREARRLFPILGTGGILGGAFGGWYTAFSASWAGSFLLLVQVGGIVTLVLGLILYVHRKSRSRLAASVQESFKRIPKGRAASDRRDRHPWRSLFGSRYLMTIAALVLTSACASTMIDLQYKWVLEDRFTGSEGDITEFFASLLGSIFIMSALVQLLVTRRILRGSGVLLGLLILPFSLVLGSVGVLVLQTFWAATILKGVDGCLRFSVDKSSTELLYVPIAGLPIKATKGFIDLMVYRLGDAAGAALFLAFTSWLEPSMRITGTILVVGSLLLGFLGWRVGREYLRMLRRSLETDRPSPVSEQPVAMLESASEEVLIKALNSRQAPKIRFALHLLMDESLDFISSVDSLIRKLPRIYSPGVVNAVAPLVDHPDTEIAAAALHLLIRYQPATHLAQLKRSCGSDVIPDDLCLGYLNGYVDDPGALLNARHVLAWSRRADSRQAVMLARLMGKTPRAEYLPVLLGWIRSENRELGRAAIRSVGAFRKKDQIQTLVDYLGNSWSRNAAREALLEYGDSIVQQAQQLLCDPSVSIAIKRELPALLVGLNSATAREALVGCLYQPDAVVSFRALKGLNKIRYREDLRYGERAFSPVLQIWAREYYDLVNLAQLLNSESDKSIRLLKKAVQERIDWTIEKMFLGLELFLPPGDAYFSYLGFIGNEHSLRENAIELIDLRVRGELRRTMLPIFVASRPADVVHEGRILFQLPSDLLEALADALYSADPWLKCCILATVKSRGWEQLRRRVKQACDDIHPLVRETARWALQNWGDENSLLSEDGKPS